MELKRTRIAVTGGAGFIGSHLVDQLLERGNQVVVFDDFSTGSRENLAQHARGAQGAQGAKSGELTVIEGDVRERPALERALRGCDVVFHLATHCIRLSLTDPVTNHDVNATGTLNALLAAKAGGARRFVYCSSSEVYGNIAESLAKTAGGLLSEESPKLPTTVYGASKLVGEHYAIAFHQTQGLPSVIVRPFNAYGPRSHFEGPYGEVIPRFTVMIRGGKKPVIFGDGKQTRDFTYVEDTARGLIAAAECDALLGDSVNLAHGSEVSVLELSRLLSELHGEAFEPKYVEGRPGEIQRLGCDTAKARAKLGFEAKIALREGVGRYLKWLDRQKLDFRAMAAAMSEKNWTEPASAKR